MIIQSELVKPGERAELLAPIPNGRRVTAINMDPPTAAAFVVETEPTMVLAGEMLAYSGINAPGVRVAIVNRGREQARFKAEVVLAPELDRIQRSIEHAFEDAWSRGGDA